MRLVARSLTLGIVALATVALSASAAGAAPKTYVPNKTGDHTPNGCTRHDCTLREAVIKANHHSGKDTILLARKTYDLHIAPTGPDDETTGDLNITNPVVIRHRGRGRATVDANGIDRVFNPSVNGLVPYTKFVKLVIRGGSVVGYGGGILTGGGPIGFTNVVVTGNHASIGGGGIFASNGELTLNRSTVRGNQAGFSGGGVGSQVDTVIRNSTISGNVASQNDNALGGGGIETFNGDLRMRNDTVTKNRVQGSGGGILTYANARLNNVTVARNLADSDDDGTGLGGGITKIGGGTFRVGNTILALNKYGGGNTTDCSGSFTWFGHNLLTGTVGCAGPPVPPSIVTSNPRLGALANNGGPTKTIALRRHSPAIGHAQKSTAEKRDQRGHKRDKHPDIGAFER